VLERATNRCQSPPEDHHLKTKTHRADGRYVVSLRGVGEKKRDLPSRPWGLDSAGLPARSTSLSKQQNEYM